MALTRLHAARHPRVLTTRCRRSWRSSGSRRPRGSGVVHRVRDAPVPATASRRCADRNRCWYALGDTRVESRTRGATFRSSRSRPARQLLSRVRTPSTLVKNLIYAAIAGRQCVSGGRGGTAGRDYNNNSLGRSPIQCFCPLTTPWGSDFPSGMLRTIVS
jgi:hypothetical protein